MKRCVIDTNVLVTANKAVVCQDDDDVRNHPELIIGCIETLQSIRSKKMYVVLDVDDEIFGEYKRYMSFAGQPGVGDIFFKWIHDNRHKNPDTQIKLHKTETGYQEFPSAMESIGVDLSDKKFFSVSYAHRSKPPIYEAVDTKWWNWAEPAKQCGINIVFIDENYMRAHSIETV